MFVCQGDVFDLSELRRAYMLPLMSHPGIARIASPIPLTSIDELNVIVRCWLVGYRCSTFICRTVTIQSCWLVWISTAHHGLCVDDAGELALWSQSRCGGSAGDARVWLYGHRHYRARRERKENCNVYA